MPTPTCISARSCPHVYVVYISPTASTHKPYRVHTCMYICVKTLTRVSATHASSYRYWSYPHVYLCTSSVVPMPILGCMAQPEHVGIMLFLDCTSHTLCAKRLYVQEAAGLSSCTYKLFVQGYSIYIMLVELMFLCLAFDAAAAVADTSGGIPGKHTLLFLARIVTVPTIIWWNVSWFETIRAM